MPKLAVVVPSNRADRIKAFCDAWRGQTRDADWFLVWDGPDTSMVPGSIFGRIDTWTSIGVGLVDSWIIPHKTAAIRSFGVLQAFRAGADYILCLDDDVLPYGPDHLEWLVDALESDVTSEWAWIGPQKQRGVPFELHYRQPWLHEGGWWNVPDLDAPTRLVEGIEDVYQHSRVLGQHVVPPGTFLALSAMHVIFRRDLAPAMYQLLQGPDWGYHRFDDIWSGMFAKLIADHLGQAVTYGDPLVEHRQASNVYTNLAQEAPGIREHELVWPHIAAIQSQGDCATCCYKSLADALAANDWAPGCDRSYWSKLAEAMKIWAGLFPCMADGGEVLLPPMAMARPSPTCTVGISAAPINGLVTPADRRALDDERTPHWRANYADGMRVPNWWEDQR